MTFLFRIFRPLACGARIHQIGSCIAIGLRVTRLVIDLTTGEIKYRTKAVYRIQILFEASKIRRG